MGLKTIYSNIKFFIFQLICILAKMVITSEPVGIFPCGFRVVFFFFFFFFFFCLSVVFLLLFFFFFVVVFLFCLVCFLSAFKYCMIS